MSRNGIDINEAAMALAGLAGITNGEALGVLNAAAVKTQGAYAAVVINLTHGEGKPLDPDSLTDALSKAFPLGNVGKRHGPHFLCHARKNRLPGLKPGMKIIPFVKKAASAASAAAPAKTSTPVTKVIAKPPEPKTVTSEADVTTSDSDILGNSEQVPSTPEIPGDTEPTEAVTAQSLIDTLGRKGLQDRAKELGVNAGGKTEEIAKRVADHMNGAVTQ